MIKTIVSMLLITATCYGAEDSSRELGGSSPRTPVVAARQYQFESSLSQRLIGMTDIDFESFVKKCNEIRVNHQSLLSGSPIKSPLNVLRQSPLDEIDDSFHDFKRRSASTTPAPDSEPTSFVLKLRTLGRVPSANTFKELTEGSFASKK